MAPIQRYNQESIVNAAYALIRREGVSALNARSIARELGCSTQPIFRLFSGMEELRMAVIEHASQEFYTAMYARMEGADAPYLQMGMHYLQYAGQEPQLFKLLFMRDRVTDGCFAREEAAYTALYEQIARSMGITPKEAALLYSRTWVYTHGLAVAIATKYIPCLSETELESLLREACTAAARQLNLNLRT